MLKLQCQPWLLEIRLRPFPTTLINNIFLSDDSFYHLEQYIWPGGRHFVIFKISMGCCTTRAEFGSNDTSHVEIGSRVLPLRHIQTDRQTDVDPPLKVC